MESKTIVAVDIGGTKIACGLVTLGGDAPVIEAVEKVPTDAMKGGAHVLATVIEQVKAAIARATVEPVGVGISSAGVVNPRTGDITFANELMPGWGGTALATEVTKATGLACRVLNDVHAHALGEARWGGGRGKASCLVAAVGTGIGGAFVEHGHIMLGAHDEAGHIGHVCCPAAAGVPCSCGATGHLEAHRGRPGYHRRVHPPRWRRVPLMASPWTAPRLIAVRRLAMRPQRPPRPAPGVPWARCLDPCATCSTPLVSFFRARLPSAVPIGRMP